MKEAPFVQLLDDLQKNYGIAFSCDATTTLRGELHALRNMREQCVTLMQYHFDEILELVKFKKPCIEHLSKLLDEYDRRIAELNEQAPPDLPPYLWKQKEDDAPPTKAERHLPKR